MKNLFDHSPHYVIMGLLLIVLFFSLLIAAVFNHSRPKPIPIQMIDSIEKFDLQYPFQSASIHQQQMNKEWIFGLGSLNAIDSSIEKKLIVTASEHAINTWEMVDNQYRLAQRCPILDDVILCLSLSPQGNAVAVGTTNGKVLVWDTGSWKQRLAIKPYPAPISFLTFSPDEKTLAILCSKGRIKLIDAQTGEGLQTIPVHSKTPCSSIVFSPNSNELLITAIQSTESYLYDAKTGEKIRTINHSQPTYPIATFSPDGQSIYCTEEDLNLPPIPIDTSQRVRNTGLNLPRKKAIATVDFSSDGQRLLTGCMDGTVKLWDTQSRQEILTIDKTTQSPRHQYARQAFHSTLPTYPQIVPPSDLTYLRFFPDGNHVLIGIIDGTIEIYDLSQQKTIQTLPRHHADIQQYAITRDWNRLLTKTLDGKIQLWDRKTYESLDSLNRYSDKFTDMMFSPDDSMFAALDYTGSIQLFETSTGKRLQKIQNPSNPESKEKTSPTNIESFPRINYSNGFAYQLGAFQSFTFSPDGKLIVASSLQLDGKNKPSYNEIKWIDIQSGKLVQTWKQNCAEGLHADLGFETLVIYKILFTPDGKKCVLAGSTENKVLDAQSGKEISNITIGVNGMAQVISPDSRFIILFNRMFELWDLKSGQYVETFFEMDLKRQYPARCVAISEDGNWLAFGSIVGTVDIYDIHGKKILYTLKIPPSGCYYLRFSPDRSQLLVGNSTEVRILDIPNAGQAKK